MQKVRKAVIPVAGYGTRFLPYTKAVPKPLLPILNKPAIQIISEEVVESGIEEILFIVGYKKDIIESHFNSVLFGDDVMYSDNGRPVIGQLIDIYEKYGKTVLGCKRVSMDDISKYASVEFDKILENDVYNMVKVTEKPKKEDAKSDLAPLGRYICSPDIFDIIRTLKPGANNEYQFTDALDAEAHKNGAVAYVFHGTRYDMGDRLGYLKANIEYGLRDEELGGKLKGYLKELIKDI
mgnify:CR=1 FL=1